MRLIWNQCKIQSCWLKLSLGFKVLSKQSSNQGRLVRNQHVDHTGSRFYSYSSQMLFTPLHYVFKQRREVPGCKLICAVNTGRYFLNAVRLTDVIEPADQNWTFVYRTNNKWNRNMFTASLLCILCTLQIIARNGRYVPVYRPGTSCSRISYWC
jgi:hypothetical protein